MKRKILAFLALLGWGVIIGMFLVAPTAHAGGPTVCSPPAGTTGKIWTGELVSCTDDAGFSTCRRRYVDRENNWRNCQPWVPDGGDPMMADPGSAPQPCAGRTTYEHWGGPDNYTCSSVPAGTTTARDKMLQATPHGRIGLITDEIGPWRGMQVWRCENREWKLESQTCTQDIAPPAPAPASRPPLAGDARVGPVPKKK